MTTHPTLVSAHGLLQEMMGAPWQVPHAAGTAKPASRTGPHPSSPRRPERFAAVPNDEEPTPKGHAHMPRGRARLSGEWMIDGPSSQEALERITAAWPFLRPDLRAAILAMVHESVPLDDEFGE